MSCFYDNAEFSDVTIKFSDQEIKAHRVILSASSSYFQHALRSDGFFKETKTGSMELKADRPQAVQSMLRWIYYLDYDTATKNYHTMTWKDHLEILVVADKYLVLPLVDIAIEKLEIAAKSSDPGQHLAAITAIQELHLPYNRLTQVAFQLATQHFKSLIRESSFRSILMQQPDWALSHLDRFARASSFKQTGDRSASCMKCNKSTLKDFDPSMPENCYTCSDCGSTGPVQLWM